LGGIDYVCGWCWLDFSGPIIIFFYNHGEEAPFSSRISEQEMLMRNIRLTIAYDGTGYHGFQRQQESHGFTIQGTLEKVWQLLTAEEITISTAGRTDAGVHAAGQVVNFRTEIRIPTENIPKAFNSLLPRDIRILKAGNETENFHARLSARWKRYDYLIYNRPIHDVFKRLYTLHEPLRLKVDRMQAAALCLEGRHNFKSFSATGGSSKTFERSLYCCQVQEEEDLLRVICIGDGFLYKMVRIIAGTLLQVAKGKLAVSEIPGLLAAGSAPQQHYPYAAPAHGLTLQYVHYGDQTPWQVYPGLSCAASWGNSGQLNVDSIRWLR
jgi:tRNA pseudouridine38-40 synthase